MIRRRYYLLAGLMALVVLAISPSKAEDRSVYLTGQLLVAAPQMVDPRFSKTVIYMVSHDPSGAFGLILNRAYGAGPMKEFLKGFDIDAGAIQGDVRLHFGGPVSPGAGFVLHTADYNGPDTKLVNESMAMTSGKSVLTAISEGHGPRQHLFAFGYAGWGAGQLDGEIAKGDWFNASPDEMIIFDGDLTTKWTRASDKVRMRL